jgi:FlaA1/EpsC-like NDP-sugar epimerase
MNIPASWDGNRFEEQICGAPAIFDLSAAQAKISGRVVLVTGAAGSIGSELCRQLPGCGPARLICIDQAETPLFQLKQSIASTSTIFRVADITRGEQMQAIFEEFGVQAVFHAAAYKHIALMEENAQEAVRNNVFGLLSVLDAAEEAGCEDFLFISSDKAVHPRSVMGCTKRIGELMVSSRSQSAMRCLSVRFGNVLGSQGSVVPLFAERIAQGRPLPVTHPEAERYFMTIQSAVCLLLNAFAVGKQGDILLLRMDAPVRILQLAQLMLQMAGVENPDERIEIVGLRPGEKLREELLYRHETAEAVHPLTTDRLLRIRGDLPAWNDLERKLEVLRPVCAQGDRAKVVAALKQIVPEYGETTERQ